MSNYTNEQIANSFNLWADYVDPDACFSEEEFNLMSIDERLKLIAEVEKANQ